MPALLLGLLVASAKSSVGTRTHDLTELAANTVLLDRSPRNATAIVTLFVSAVSIAGALFLILELDRPFSGLLQIPSAPLRHALSVLGK
jgi:hypothetical protein